MITVTKPHLPELEDFIPYLQSIWENKQLTNNGPFHQELEKQLCSYLGVPYISLFSNATLGLLTAMQALDVRNGEVITTPYSFVATTHAITWNGNTPVFVDVRANDGNINPDLIEAAISENTKAILPVHVYGQPCECDAIQRIADKYQLPLIYDAAHCFGVNYQGKSLLNFGDLSVVSFHATKVFNTFEGGAIISHTAEMKQRIDDLKNFGFRDETTVIASGINAKMNEIQAAFGLLQLKTITENLQIRRKISRIYREGLSQIPGLTLFHENQNFTENGAYFPIFVDNEYPLTRDELYEHLKENNIFGRRYFYPLISNFSLYAHLPSSIKSNLTTANSLAERVICLPIYPDISEDSLAKIITIIRCHGRIE
jgi:dTDP-4-amino-4,6-dideoxygalactose transaminase